MKKDRGRSPTPSATRNFMQLKQWRAAKAAEAGQPAFWVLHNTALAEISERLPVPLKNLPHQGLKKQERQNPRSGNPANGRSIPERKQAACPSNSAG